MKFLILLLLLQIPMISSFVSEKEAYSSKIADARGISNIPTAAQKAAIKKVCVEHFDPLRRRVGSPLYISSFFRSPALNKAVQGAKYSDHQVLKDPQGFYEVAIDIDQDGRGKVGNRALFFIVKEEIQYYKLIWEFGTTSQPSWVHLSFSTDPAKNKLRKTYRAVKIGNKTSYQVFSASGLK